MARKLNPAWERAAYVAREMGNDSDPNILRIKREFSVALKNISAINEKRVADGLAEFDEDDLLECWKWLKTRDDFPIDQATITTTTFRGSPPYIAQWEAHMKDSMPSVVFTAEFDDWVRQNAAYLRKRCWRYVWPDEASMENGSRMTYTEAKELGLVEE